MKSNISQQRKRFKIWNLAAGAIVLAASALCVPHVALAADPPVGCFAPLTGEFDPSPRGIRLSKLNATQIAANFCVVSTRGYGYVNAIVSVFSAAGDMLGSNSWGTTDAAPNMGGSNPALMLPISVGVPVGAAHADMSNLYDSVLVELQWCTAALDAKKECPSGLAYHYFLLHYTTDTAPRICPKPSLRHRHHRPQ